MKRPALDTEGSRAPADRHDTAVRLAADAAHGS